MDDTTRLLTLSICAEFYLINKKLKLPRVWGVFGRLWPRVAPTVTLARCESSVTQGERHKMLLRWTWQSSGIRMSRPEAVPPCWDNIQWLLPSSIKQGDEWGAPGWPSTELCWPLDRATASAHQEGTAGLGKGWQNPRHSERGQLKSFLVLLWELFSHGFSWCGDCLEAQGINENLWKPPRCCKWTKFGCTTTPLSLETKSGRDLPQRMHSLLSLSSLLLNSTFIDRCKVRLMNYW